MILDAALKLAAERGLPLIPCNEDKRPIVKGWNMIDVRTPEHVTSLFNRPEARLIGVRTGRVSSLFVVDIDPRNGGDAWYTENAHRLDCQRIHRTRSGGWHLLYQVPDDVDVPTSAGKLAPGVDIRGDGGQIIWWPAHGFPPEKDGVPGPAPEWLLKELIKKPQRKPNLSARYPEGTRNDSLTREGGRLRHKGMSGSELEAALISLNTERSDPPLPEAEVLQIAASLERYPPGPAVNASPKVRKKYAGPLDKARYFVAARYRSEDGRSLLFANRGDFFAWDGSSYRKVASEKIRAQLYAWLDQRRTPDKRYVDDVVDALRAETFLDVSRFPAWRISDPPAPAHDLIACRNGLLQVSTKLLLAPTPDFLNLNAVDYNYEPEAAVPTELLAFLHSVWAAQPECIDALQEWFGLLLTSDTQYQKILLIIGPRRSGKGTLARALRGLIGEPNVSSPTIGGLGTQFGLAGLIGSQLAIVSDARLSGRTDLAAVTENLLRISGEDSINVPKKYQSDWVGQLSARFVVLTNELPAVLDSSGALASRFIVLPMTQSFYGREDHGLTARLLLELPGIMNWALIGLDRLRARGHLLQPAAGAALVEELDRLASPIRAFVADRCTITPGAEILVADLYDAYSAWCEEQHRDHPGTVATLGRYLLAAYPQIQTVQQRDPWHPGKRRRVYRGIRLQVPEKVETYDFLSRVVTRS